MNNSGDVVGAYWDGVSNKAFLWRNGTFMDIEAPGAVDTIPTAINNRGDIVGLTYGMEPGSRGFLLTKDDEFTSIVYPGAEFTVATGITARGEIVGNYSGEVSHGFIWSDGRLTTLDVPGAESTVLEGTNSKGDLVGFYWLPVGPIRGFALVKH